MTTAHTTEQGQSEEKQHGHQEVTIHVNNHLFKIQRGHRTVEEIKKIAGVPLAHDLEQAVHKKLILLPDDGAVEIEGEEKFFSHVKDGSSS